MASACKCARSTRSAASTPHSKGLNVRNETACFPFTGSRSDIETIAAYFELFPSYLRSTVAKRSEIAIFDIDANITSPTANPKTDQRADRHKTVGA